METVKAVLQNRIVMGAVAGALTAALVDFNAFRTWKTWSEASTFQWKTAALRWLQGAVVGALTGAGLNLGGAQ